MREASLEDITKFLECKRVAFVGVSRDTRHISRALFREFVAKGYDPVPVNPQAAEIEGCKCFGRVSEITPLVEAALLLTGTPDATDDAVRECNKAEIRNIWIYKNVHDSKEHEQAIDFSRSHGTAIVEGYCPFMFLPHPALFHRVHRFMTKVTGNYPL
jgi:predicted CoA-binding protein